MKTISLFFLLFHLSFVPFTSGHGDKSECEFLQSDSFTASVDGEAFVADEFWAGASEGVIIIQAYDEDEVGFLFQFPDNLANGDHELSYDNAETIQCTYSTGFDGGEAMSGTLRITNHDRRAGRIEAIFSFRGELSEGDSFEVSEGRFALSYK